MKYLVTGSAGFIGFHLSRRLLELGHEVFGIDNLNNYYDVKLKNDRNAILMDFPNYFFNQIDVAEIDGLRMIFSNHKPNIVIHLAAQAGVRYSIENPYIYSDSNLTGFLNVLECCRRYPVMHLLYASSSSVYGTNAKIPFSEQDKTDYPISFYGATKKANEVMAYAYSQLYKINCSGLRFFTVYGPWGRPDMAYFSFVKNIVNGNPIKVFNYGKMQRDFTYIDDIIEGIVKISDFLLDDGKSNKSNIPYARIYNIGNSHPIVLEDFIDEIERVLGISAVKEYLPMQAGDMEVTYADVSALIKDTGYHPKTPFRVGIENFVKWYCAYYEKR